MATITAKVVSATNDESGKATIVIEFDDGNRVWKKEYTQRDSVIKLDRFKEIVRRDLVADLKVNTQLEEITPLVGKTFTINL